MSSQDLSAYILQLLRQKNITQKALAEAVHVSRKSINEIINAKVTEPKIGTLVIISRHLGVHPMALMRELFRGWEFPNIHHTGAQQTGDAVGFVRDVTFPDNSSISVGKKFIKTWEIQNIGNTPWTNRSLVCVDGQFDIIPKNQTIKPPITHRGLKPSSRTIAIQQTQPWEKISLSVEFTAPDYPCTVISYWKMVDQDGNLCFPENEGLSCQAHVIGF